MASRWKSNSSISSNTLEDQNLAATTEQDPLISIEDRQKYNSIGSSSSYHKHKNASK